MDTHIKEGQLYVQHQKFGKVSRLCFCFAKVDSFELLVGSWAKIHAISLSTDSWIDVIHIKEHHFCPPKSQRVCKSLC